MLREDVAIAVLGLVLLSLGVAVVGCGRSQSVRAEVTAVDHPEGTVIRTGSSATAAVRIKNTGTEDHTFWIGYSVQDPAGKWHDAPAIPVELTPEKESDVEELSTAPLETPGYYKTRVSVWSEKPEGEQGDNGSNTGSEAQRLANAEETSTLRLFSTREDFDSPELDANRWEATSKKLGRGKLEPENVSIKDGQLRLTLPADTWDGSEIESKGLHGSGFYAARIKVPDASSSITGFFLYNPPDLASEIDIEIYNDSSRKILFTAYAGGKQTHTETIELPFDPTEDFHDYAFFYDPDSVTFYVDGEPMKKFEGGLPDKPMKLYVNSWFPTWLPGEKPNSDREVYVDWIEY